MHDKTMKQRETNKRAQKRHRDRTRVRVSVTYDTGGLVLGSCSPALSLLSGLYSYVNASQPAASCLQAKEELASQQIAALTAELRKSQREKGLIEQRADTLSTALAVRGSASPKVHVLSQQCLFF